MTRAEQQRIAERWERIERGMLRMEAAFAQRSGIDIFQPGWRDELLELDRKREEENARIDSLIATPHIDDAIERLEQQFTEDEVTS